MSNQSEYSWFKDTNKKKLKCFLNKLAKDENVNELIILGDFIDLWLYPLETIPLNTGKIFEKNLDVVKAFQSCVRNIPNVYYMPGNHDMGIKEADLSQLKSGDKSVRILTQEEYSKMYDNMRHLEHGHMVDMFNAPDESDDTIGGYPLGYFITRIVTSANPKNQFEVYEKLIIEIRKFLSSNESSGTEIHSAIDFGHLFISTIITALELFTGVSDKTLIRFEDSEIDKKYSVGDIKNHYSNLYNIWLKKWPDNLLNTMLTGFIQYGLNWYSDILLNKPKPPTVLVMGHTHYAIDAPYDNDGSWCNSGPLYDKSPHYVEVIGNEAKMLPFDDICT